MAETRDICIYFTDGSQISLTFPKQTDDDYSAVNKLSKLLERSELVFDVDGEIYIFQTSSIKYIRVSHDLSTLPDYVIKGASIK